MNVAIGIGASLVLAALLVRILENRLVYFPPRYPEGFESPDHDGLGVEEIWITADDGVRLNAWYWPNPTSSKVLLCFHGNAENIGHGLGQLKALSRLGASVLALDYRGYGKSEGSPDEAGVYRDAESAYNYLVDGRHFQPRDIFLYGNSLGGAVAIHLAWRHEIGGLIVQSSFTAGREMARRMFLIPLFEYIPKSRFDSLDKIARVRAPILIVHGTQDQTIPFSMGRRLYEAAPEPKSFLPIEGAGHNDIPLVGGERYLERLRTFISGSAKP